MFRVTARQSSQPLGAVSLLHYTVTRTALADRAHGLILSKGGTIRHWLAAETSDSADDWQSVFEQASRVPIQVFIAALLFLLFIAEPIEEKSIPLVSHAMRKVSIEKNRYFRGSRLISVIKDVAEIISLN